MNDFQQLNDKVSFLGGLQGILRTSDCRSSLNSVELTGSTRPGAFTHEVFEAIKSRRLRQRFTLDEGPWSIGVNVNELQIVTIDESGPVDEVFEPADVELISQAIADKDVGAILGALESSSLQLSVSVVNDPSRSGVHYLERFEILENRLSSRNWHAFVMQIAEHKVDLVVGDIVGRVQCGGFCVTGPLRDNLTALSGEIDSPPNPDSRLMLPSPLYFAPVADVAGSEGHIRKIAEWMHGISRCLAWYWLANSVYVEPERVQIEFASTRVVSIELLIPAPVNSSRTEVEAFQWSMSYGDPARLEAMRQAVTLAGEGNNPDLEAMAVPALRTAKSLYQVAKQGVVSEALATRRAARQATFSIATDAAKASREASAKAVERVMVQSAAAVGVLIANAKDLVNGSIAVVVLLLVALIALTTWRSSSRRDIELAEQTLTAMDKDLNEYREALSSEDIDSIRNMQTLTATRQYLVKARRTVGRLAISVVVGCFAAGGYVIIGNERIARAADFVRTAIVSLFVD